jgi:guanyl-specific ribonuclease Sa
MKENIDMLNENYALSNFDWSNFSPTDFNPTDFNIFIPPPMPPNVSTALGPLTDSQVVDDLFADLLPWLEVFPDGYIQNNTYLSNLVGREAEIQALDLAAYNRSIAKEFGMSWQDYQSRIIELRSQQQSFSPLEEQNTQGGYDDYTNGSWSAYDVNPNTGLTGNSNQIGAAQIGRYFVQTGAPYDPTPNNGIVNVTIPGYWVPLGGVSQYSPLYTPIGNARAGQNQTNQVVLPFPALPPSASVLTAVDQLNLDPVFHREVPNDAEFSAALAIVAAVLRNPRFTSRGIFDNIPKKPGDAILPRTPGVTYYEYTVPIPTRLGTIGSHRIVYGSNGTWFYTMDHYHTFWELNVEYSRPR